MPQPVIGRPITIRPSHVRKYRRLLATMRAAEAAASLGFTRQGICAAERRLKKARKPR